jgi:hypothetical protein
MFTLYYLTIKKRFLHQNNSWILKLSKQKKVLKMLNFFLTTVVYIHTVQGTQCDTPRKFPADHKIFKKC